MVMRWLRLFPGLLAVLTVPVLLVTSAVRWEVSDLRLYRVGFVRQGVERATGISLSDLMAIAGELHRYLVTGKEPLAVQWQGRSLFTEVEVLHMRDVKGLMQGVFRAQEGAGAYLLAYLAVGLLLGRGAFLRGWAKQVLWGSLLTLGVMGLAGVILVAAFPWAFTLFHLASFRNPFWQLDPSRHYLVRLFPQGFWFEAALGVGLLAAAGAVLVALAAAGLLRAIPPRSRAWREFLSSWPFP